MASISNVPSGALAYVPGQTAKVSSTPTQSASNGGAQSGNSVQISAKAQQLSKWDSLSKAEQRALYDTTMDAFLALDRSYAMPGQLTSIIYDDSGTYTVSERYAAWGEQQRQDYINLSHLFALTTNGGDNRQVYKGLLDYFDALSSIERSIYPDDYRDKLAHLLEAQEAQYGKLETSAPNDSASASKSSVESFPQITSASAVERMPTDEALSRNFLAFWVIFDSSSPRFHEFGFHPF